MTRQEQALEIIKMTADMRDLSAERETKITELTMDLYEVTKMLAEDGMSHLPMILDRMVKEQVGYKFSRVLNTMVDYKVVDHGPLTILHVNETDVVEQLMTHSSSSSIIVLTAPVKKMLKTALNDMLKGKPVQVINFNAECEEMEVRYNVDHMPEIDLIRIRSFNQNGTITDVSLNLEIMKDLFGKTAKKK